MTGVRIRHNFAEAITWLNLLATKQVPFAMAAALTQTAADVQKDVRAQLPKDFTLRGTWVIGGIRTVRAEKKDWPHSRALVGSRDEFMELQETGGTKRPAKGARNLAIPTKATTIRRSGGGRLPKGAKPRAILSRPSGFVKFHEIRKRLAKNVSGAKSLALFLLRPQAHVTARFHFERTANATVARVYASNFKAAFAAAISAPRKPTRLK